jgi:glycosyltransferase involved in cell wall biosynthesis
MLEVERVSIVVPTYNQAKYFPICLDTIWQQDYGNIEIVLVNDGSTDTTAQAISEYLKGIENDEVSYASNYNERDDIVERTCHARYARHGRDLKVITHEVNRGLGATLNTGFKACTGTYCTYIASDDYFYPSMVSDCVNELEKENADFVYADINIVDDSGRIIRRFDLPEYSFKNCFYHWYLCGICKLYKRRLHDELGYYREDLFAHDVELYQRFAMNGKKLIHLRKILAAARHHGAERQIHNHTPRNWSRLFQECKQQALIARKFTTTHKID